MDYIQPRNHPLRFLLHLEWVLLGIIAVIELLRFQYRFPHNPVFNLLCLGIFAAIGLRIPIQSAWKKIVYTAIELALILATSNASGLRIVILLYVVLVIRNCLMVQGTPRLFIAIVTFSIGVSTLTARWQEFMTAERSGVTERAGVWLSSAFLLGLVFVFLQLLVNAALSEQRNREELAIANNKLRHYVLQVEEIATLQERNRIAREIHDALGHSLTAFHLHLEAALRLLDSEPTEAKELLVEAKQLSADALQEVRQSVSTLRTDPVWERNLESAIASLIKDFQRSTNLSPRVNLIIPKAINANVKTAIYRIIQEALTNICKYANATNIEVRLQAYSDELQLNIKDNGKGFIQSQTTSGFGLQGMRERTLALDGHFEIVTAPDQGCQILATFPIGEDS
jgi:signal transduction histidine kinase